MVPAAAEADHLKNVLILNAYHQGYQWTDDIVRGILDSMDEVRGETALYIEYMDSKRHFSDDYIRYLTDVYRLKYGHIKFDVIITSDENAFYFLRDHHEDIFHGQPTVFCGVNYFEPYFIREHENITGLAEVYDVEPTLDLILKLRPETRRIAVISDGTPTGISNLQKIEAVMDNYSGKLEFRFLDLSALCMGDLLNTVSELPEDTAILLLSAFRDRSGRYYPYEEYVPLISRKATVPMFCLIDTFLEYGCVGGKLNSGYYQGAEAGKMARTILKGTPVSRIPVSLNSRNRYMFNYPEMARFGIEKTDLPPKSRIRNLPPESMFEKNRYYFWTGGIFLFFQSSVILFLFLNMERRKQVEKALRESEEKYRELVQSANSIILRMKPDGTITFFNEFAERFFGYSQKEITGQNAEGTIIPVQEDGICGIERMLADTGPGTAFSTEALNVRRNGDPVRIAWTHRAIYDKAGNLTELLWVGNDITEQKRLEKQLQQAQKMEAIGTLAGGVAHDLNNILSGLVSYPDVLLLSLPRNSPLRKPLITIQKSGEKAAAIVSDLLTLARRGVSVTELVNLNDIIQEYLKSPVCEKLKADHPAVSFNTRLAPDLFNITGSPTHISQTVMNLISNAAEAIPDSGIISISTENRYVNASVDEYAEIGEGDYVVLVVSDTGIGISPEDIPRIFDPFYTKKKMGNSGSGLGLAVIWGAVRDHKGHIDVKSTPGQGTQFTIFLPATRQKTAAGVPRSSLKPFMGKEKILVVDDVRIQREVAQEMLRALGYEVVTVSSGEEALEYLKSNRADILVLDMIMPPGMDGLATFRQVTMIRPGQKAIIVSGFAETARVKAALRLGAGAYIRKPYTMEKIGEAVRRELDR